MDEKALWQRFCENGSVTDYLNYRNCVDSEKKTELESIGENDCTRLGYKGTDDRGIR
jgi:hypothetical protein